MWNTIVRSLRARDLLSNAERDELLFFSLREDEHAVRANPSPSPNPNQTLPLPLTLTITLTPTPTLALGLTLTLTRRGRRGRCTAV